MPRRGACFHVSTPAPSNWFQNWRGVGSLVLALCSDASSQLRERLRVQNLLGLDPPAPRLSSDEGGQLFRAPGSGAVCCGASLVSTGRLPASHSTIPPFSAAARMP